MLNISFFITTFSSIFWLIFNLKYINFHTIATNGYDNLFYGVMVTLFPIALIWGIFAIIKSHFTEKRITGYMYNVFEQLKNNTSTTANIGQSLLSAEAEIKNCFFLQEFNLLISDINEILSDIIKRSNSISSAQLEHLWTQTAGGERWIMAKTFIEITNYQPEFSEHLKEKALKDPLLKGSILEFYTRYKTIHDLLQTNNSVFFNIIECGALGKVFETITPIADYLSTQKIPASTEKKPASSIQQTIYPVAEETLSFPSFLSQTEEKKPTVDIPTSEAPQQPSLIIENGLRAIREEILTPTADNDKKAEPIAPIISDFKQTEQALRSITPHQKEKKPATESKKTPVISLEELEKEIASSPENNYDEYAYPFGAWLNGKNNK